MFDYQKYIDFVQKYSIVLGTLAVILMCYIFYLSVLQHGKSVSESLSHRTEYFSMKDTVVNGVKTVFITDEHEKLSIIIHPSKYKNIYAFNRSLSQLKISRNRMMAHNRAIDYFITNLYFFIVIQTIFMILVLILGVVISRKGWYDSDPKMLLVFLLSVGFLVLFQILPKAMKIEENLQTNREYFRIYVNIENEMMTYLSSDEERKDFSKDVDALLKQYHAIAFDLQQIPFSEVKKQFEEARGLADKKDGDDK